MLEKLMGNKPFEYKKLTEAEQKARGILGRLVGVIADTKEPTRNGRHYSEQLWENVFEDPIMKEKIANRCCFGELNHPADRTETDMEKVAICLAEPPKKGKDGKLYGVFDILSTPCGKILKALCDYGCKIGISSRGQGDLIQGMNGEEVDPDTYECECFDAVLVPGVETARLTYVTESLQSAKTMKKVLNESFRSAESDDEIRIMKEQFKDLNILTESDEVNEEDVIEIVDDENAETKSDLANEVENESEVEEESDENIEVEDNSTEDESKEDDNANVFLDYLANNFDEDKIKEVCKILNIEVEDEEETAESDESTTEEVDSEVEEETTEEKEEKADDSVNEISTEEEKTTSDEGDIEEKIEETNKTETSEALDIGSKVLVNSLKEALKGKSDLEAQVRNLQEKLAASDTRVNEINEECNKYKSAISRLSLVAKSSKDLKESKTKLEEALEEKDQIINAQKERISRLVKSRKASVEQNSNISESITKKDAEIGKLNESLTSATQKYDDTVSKLNEQLKTSQEESNKKIAKLNENLEKATKLKEGYKDLANKAINKYIGIKAETLGVTPKDIKRKLGESYTIEDVDQVCEDLKSYQLNISKLPFNVDKNVGIKGVKVNEANANKASKGKAFDDDSVDDVLFKIANID